MAHLIEPARSGRSRCQSCRRPIGKGALRLSEEFVSEHGNEVAARFHHLRCAAGKLPYILRSALATTSLDIPDRAGLEQEIERALTAADVAAQDDDVSAEYREAIARLAADPDDDDARLVFADWLQSVADPRGELIAVQTRLETATGDDQLELVAIERHLLATHRKQFIPDLVLDARLTWRRGFVDRLELTRTTIVHETLARMLVHPSFRLLRGMSIDFFLWWADELLHIVRTLPPLPATLRVLELGAAVPEPDRRFNYWSPVDRGGGDEMSSVLLGDIADRLCSLPGLRRLRLGGVAAVERIAHPALEELEILAADGGTPRAHEPAAAPISLAGRLAQLRRADLPALRKLTVHVLADAGSVRDALAATDLPPDVIDVRTGNDPHRLERVAAAPAPTGDWLVRHTRRPEWGIGRVIDEQDDLLTVEFEHAGVKEIRSRKLLEDA